MSKEKTEPINISESLKRFLEDKKINLKKETGKFHNMTETLMYYLLDSDKFVEEISQ